MQQISHLRPKSSPRCPLATFCDEKKKRTARLWPLHAAPPISRGEVLQKTQARVASKSVKRSAWLNARFLRLHAE